LPGPIGGETYKPLVRLVCSVSMSASGSILLATRLLVGVASWFERATAEGAVSSGGGALWTALGATAKLAEPGGHPLIGAEETFQKRGKIEVGVQFREVNAEARRANFYVAKRRGGCVFQTLSEARRKADIKMGTEVNDDAAALAVVVRGYSPRSRLAHLAGALIC
jgi:hypothetical protein